MPALNCTKPNSCDREQMALSAQLPWGSGDPISCLHNNHAAGPVVRAAVAMFPQENLPIHAKAGVTTNYFC